MSQAIPAAMGDLVWSRPSPQLWTARQVSLALVVMPLAALALVPAWIAGGAAGPAASVAVVAAAALAWWLLRGRVRSWAYLERADDLIVRRGLLFRQTSVVPYGRMQFVDVSAGPIDRLFGLATVQLHTAAAASDARIPGLAQAEAERLRDRLTALGEAQATGL
ncbi:MAG: PH domain-containing protein [Candidatus Dormibacteria bacterium]